MGAEATVPTKSDTAATATLPRKSLGALIAISIFWFAINFHWTALNIFVTPSQVIALLLRAAPAGTLAAQSDWVDHYKPLALAIVTAPGLIVALIANPLFGVLSDRTRGRFGRRLPYIIAGTLLNVVGLAVMAYAPSLFVEGNSGNPVPSSLLVLMLGLMVTQLANNAAAAPFHALLPDLVPEEQRGVASGIMGFAFALGTIGGAIAAIFAGFSSDALTAGGQTYETFQHGLILAYGLIAAVIVAMALLTIVTVREAPLAAAPILVGARDPETHTIRNLTLAVAGVLAIAGGGVLLFGPAGVPADDFSLSGLELVALAIAGVGAARAFGFSPRRTPDFSWVVITRMVLMLGIYLVENFLLFYMHDVAHAPDANAAAAQFLVIATCAAMLSSAVAGWASDHIGRKRMIYISGAVMAAVGAAFIVAPYAMPEAVLSLTLWAGAVFGVGFGAYSSVDWALVADVLPSHANYARDMGIWNIGLIIPQVLASFVGGLLLTVGFIGLAVGHTNLGYSFLFTGFVIFCVLGTVTVRFIKGVKR